MGLMLGGVVEICLEEGRSGLEMSWGMHSNIKY